MRRTIEMMHKLKKDCRFFDGSKPCVWNKTEGCECPTCRHYSRPGLRVLNIKLAAIGDVLRSTCVVSRFRREHGDSHITWITEPASMELLQCNDDIDEVWSSQDMATLTRLMVQQWDVVFSLDNSHAGASLAGLAKAPRKVGFVLTDEGITATNEAASYWLQMATTDRLKKENTRSYQEIMYEICGLDGPVLRPGLPLSDKLLAQAQSLVAESFPHELDTAPMVGINTGSGLRWPKKMLDSEQIIDVIAALLARMPHCRVLLLGGPAETDKNAWIASRLGCDQVKDAGCNHSLLEFAAIIAQCRLLLCGDTLALHMATALEVPAVAIFGPTSFAEIYDYGGLIEKVRSTELDCLCCYGNCDKSLNCMTTLSADDLAGRICARLVSEVSAQEV
ncbi:MAG: glycosyltransferase family 9 protein [Planctomycetes bacterium]|nr:glycosyltransferase family 9 protein [Planctomycetota bacterium]